MKDELAQVKHARSEKDYPELKLEPDEHVVLHLKRSRVGVIALWCMVAFCIIVLSFALIMIANSLKNNETLLVVNDDALGYLRIAIFALYAVVIAGGMVKSGRVAPGMLGRAYRKKDLLGEFEVSSTQEGKVNVPSLAEGEIGGLSLKTTKKIQLEIGDTLKFFVREYKKKKIL